MKEDRYEFSKRLKSVMTALDMSQTELAERTGITQACISQLLNGLRDPSLDTVARILSVIPVKFETLVKIR